MFGKKEAGWSLKNKDPEVAKVRNIEAVRKQGMNSPEFLRHLRVSSSAAVRTQEVTASGLCMLALRGVDHFDVMEHILPWPAASFVDSGLSWHSAGHELHGTEVAQFRVPSARVVEAFEVVEDIGTTSSRVR